jgi:DNA invertase Pin-like site-specific DNA recombinase
MGIENILGERCCTAKLSNAEAQQILDMHGSGQTAREIAERYGISHYTVWDIWKRKRWKHLTPKTNRK